MSDFGQPAKNTWKKLHCGTARRSKEKECFQLLMEVNLHLLIKTSESQNQIGDTNI